MPRENPHRPFTPDPAQMALKPEVSGNDINGLGETDHRRPRMVYWAPDPDDIPHGPMQRYFYTQRPTGADDLATAAAIRAERQEILDAPLAPLSAVRTDRTADEWAEGLAGFVAQGDCEDIGVTALQADWLFEGYDLSWRRVIVLAVQHDYATLSQAPEAPAGNEVLRQYMRAAKAAKDIASWLRRQGWDAEPVTGPMTGSLALIPPALACGLGELGKHGSVIHPRFGANFRLSAVMTDAPIPETPARVFGVDDFCTNCRICEEACPPEALFSVKQTVRGQEKWYVDFDRCLPYFNQHQGCAICIAVCPWSRPGVAENLAEKLTRRAERLG